MSDFLNLQSPLQGRPFTTHPHVLVSLHWVVQEDLASIKTPCGAGFAKHIAGVSPLDVSHHPFSSSGRMCGCELL